MPASEIPRLLDRIAFLERQVECLSRGVLEQREFAFKGKTLPYFLHSGNRTYSNERAVELPIAWSAVSELPSSDLLIEVGNVLGRYFDTNHIVVDKYEQHDKVTYNMDVLEFVPDTAPALVISVSTLEHVGFSVDTRDATKFRRVVEHIVSWLSPGGRLVFTVPLGYNPAVEAFVRAPGFPEMDISYLKRVSGYNLWEEAASDEVRGVQYDTPYQCANAIAVAEIKVAGAAGRG